MNRISNTGYRLKEYRDLYDLTLADLEKRIAIPAQTINRYELQQRIPKVDVAVEIADKLDINPLWLQGYDVPMNKTEKKTQSHLPSNVTRLPKMKKIPLVGQIACGIPILAEQNITDYIDLPTHINADYALTCKGESMVNIGINDGDVVYIRQQEDVENGQVAAVMVDEDEATLKRFYHTGNVIQLVAENSTIPPSVYIGEEITRIRVLGLAVAYTHIIE